MTRTSTIVGLIVASALLALASCSFATAPVHAAACDYTYDDVAQQFADAGSPVMEIPAEQIPELVADVERRTHRDLHDVTRAFVAQAGAHYLLGIEEDGCLLPPLVIGFTGAPVGATV